ncbi:MAG: class I SAM-dependent methyltransferase [Planctomycetaceae bacterium]
MSERVHRTAAVGFERAAGAYERGRPDFPGEAVAFLVERLELAPGRVLLELGAGTGKLTRLLVQAGARIVAVEPVSAMREALRAAAPSAAGLDAVAEDLPLPDASVDAAVAAQAFHWFDGPRAVHELGRVLPAGGPVALVWNVRDENEPWVRGLTELIEPYRGDAPSHRSMRWREAFDRSRRFAPLERVSFVYAHRTTADAVVDRIVSISFVAALPDAERERVAEGVRALVPGAGPGAREVVFPYRTDVWTTRRR